MFRILPLSQINIQNVLSKIRCMTFDSCYIPRLRHIKCLIQHVRIQRGDRGSGPPPPEKSQKYRVSLQCWSGSPEKSQSYQATIQCWAIIGPPAKRPLNGVLLASRRWPAYWYQDSSFSHQTIKKKQKKSNKNKRCRS